MNKFTFSDSSGNRTGKAKRWLGWLAFGGVLLLGQIGFAYLMPNLKEASNNELVSTETQTEQIATANNYQVALASADDDDPFDCSQISPSTGTGGGYLIGGDNSQELAGDFMVYAGNTFDVTTVKVSVNTSSTATFDVIFWSDNAGVPDTVLNTITGVTSTSPVLSAGTYYMHTLDISSENLSFAPIADTRYWVQVTTTGATAWERRSNTLALGVDDVYRQNSGTWNTIYTDPANNEYNLVYEVVGECTGCMPPTNLTVTQSSDDVTLGWTGSGGDYDVEWGMSGFVLGTGTQITGLTTNSTVISTSTLDTGVYEFYVSQECIDGDMSAWAGPFSFGIGYYSGGDIPTLYGAPTSSAGAACTPEAILTIDVPAGYQISNINVQYDMTAWGGAWMSEQRSALWSPTINMGETTIATGTGATAGTFSYDRNTSFANGATGSVDFVLKAWRTYGGSGCGTTYNYVNNNTWIITPTFELLPDCPTPISLNVNGTTYTSADLSWLSPGTAFDIEYGVSGFTPTGNPNDATTTAVGNPYTLTGLTAETSYQYYVRQNCTADGDGYSTWAGPFSFFTGYCEASSLYTGYRITDFSTTSGYTNISNLNNGIANSYNNYSAFSVSQSEGGSFDYAVSVPGYTNVEIWIDYNNNMMFDTDELVAEHVYGTANTTFTGTIDLPATIAEGDYRMRVRSRYYWNSSAQPCGSMNYGETEDYTVSIVPMPDCMPPSALTATPVSLSEVTLGWTSAGSTFDVEWGAAGFTLGSGTQINGLTTTTTSVNVTIDTPYQYYVRQDCTADGDGYSLWAGPFPFQTGYCIPQYLYGCSNGAKISNFVTSDAILNIANNTGTGSCGADGYNNFTAISAAAPENSDVSVAVSIGSYGAGVRIWIDWNSNGVFETDELMTESTAVIATGGTFTGDFTVPAGTPNGDYRMRVRVVEGNTGFDPCTIYNYGETEDYTFTVIDPPACMPPSGLAVDGVTFTSADLSWNSAGTSFDIEYGVSGFTPTGSPNDATTTGVTSPYTLGGLTAETNYQYYVRQDCTADGDGYSLWAGPFPFYTGYCVTSSLYTGNRITDFSTTSGYTNILNLNNGVANAYNDYSALSVTQSEGGSFDYAVSVPSYTNVEIWIDFNNNMIFDTDELVAEHVYGTANTTFTGTIDLPATIADGDYRMRVRSRYYWNSSAQPCGSMNYGETEDYTLTVTPVPACMPPSGLGVAGVTFNSATLSWSSAGDTFDVEYGVSGFTPTGNPTDATTTGVSNLFELTGLTAETHYQYYVRQDCTADGDGYSLWSGPFPFYTGYCLTSVEWVSTSYRITDFSTTYGYTNIMNLNNGVNNDYNNFSNLSVTQSEGGSFNYAVSVPSYTNLEIWVDFNNNMMFDTDELVAEHVYLAAATTFTGTINIPTGLADGDYRIRVRSRYYYNTIANPCGQISYGEVEDYTLTIVPVPDCMPPNGLSATPTSLTEVTLAWSTTGDLFDVEWGPQGFALGSGTQINGLTTNSTSVDVTIDVPYQFYVRQDCTADGDGYSLWSGPFNFKTGYCVPQYLYGCAGGAKITNVETFDALDNIANDTGNTSCGANGYNNFSSISATAVDGTTVPFEVGIGGWAAAVKVWVDWNNNGVFESTELMSESTGTIASGGTYSGEIAIPLGSAGGSYRLRVRAVESTTVFDACNIQNYGETEDYTLIVIEQPDCMFPQNMIAVNTSATGVSLSWSSTGTVFDIEYGPAGFTPGTGTMIPGVGNPYTLSPLTGGVTYDYYVRQDCTIDGDGYSMWRGPISFTPGVFEGNIPTLLNADPQVDDIACATSFAIDVPDGQFLASLQVQYVMTSANPAYTSHQRSVLYSSTLGMGEAAVALPTGGEDFPGVIYYNRAVTFANGATGTIEFELKAWRTTGGSGCGENLVFVEDGTWVLNATFEDIPACPNPATDLGYANPTADSVDLVWTSAEAGTFQVKWGNVGFNVETEGTEISDIDAFSYTLSGLDSTIPYDFYVRRDCSTDDEDEFGEWAGPVRFNSGHCIPYATQGFYFTLFNTTNAVENVTYSYPDTALGTGYVNSTTMIITEDAGETFNFTSNFVGGASGLRIWVDWNNDFIFGDDEEVFFLAGGTGNKSGTITIPADTPGGDYRMRVRAQTGATANPPACGLVAQGEALDFTLRVSCDEVATPTGLATQQFTVGQTLADLDVTGDNLVWYADEDLTIVLDPSTELVDATIYYVVSTNGGCQSDYLAVTVEQTSGVADFNNFGFRYYPNPVTDMMYLSANTPISNVTVINMLGQEVNVPANSDNTSLDMSGLPTGNYLIKVTIEGVSKMLKVVKK